ncbi:hypothetical protein DFQ27_007485 [Actinomortierella ambigua]|uniref:Uncharacterized protein n=1 Tax=Actinomortierella ambigua TaxID=1343610 RepID=A0A9P6PUL9_9FUNG|nr:hypothetical protein DFQ27_007485 [Actinomortierella ambigua]
MDIISSKPGYIAQGSYTKAIQWTLDPSWPSSFDQYEVSQQGWVRYCISATMDKLPSGFLSALGSYAIMQEFWVVLPGADVLDPSIPPEVHFPIAEPQAHLSCFTPSNRLHLDEVVPLTFRFAPPASLTEGPGQGEPPATWTIERADIELKQISNYYPSGPDSLEVLSLVIAEVPIHSGWPAPGGSIEPWERVVYMVVPGFEKSATSFTSRYLHVRHQIKVKVVLRSSASPKTVLWKHKFDVNINGIKVLPPSIEASGEAEFLPEYTAE